MNAIRLQIYLEEPLLATGVANGEENSSTSLGYIPGSALRGACIAAFQQLYPDIENIATDSEKARQLFFEEKVFFLNGYPTYPFDASLRALPRPLSWHMNKDEAEIPVRQVRDYVWPITPFEKSKRESRLFYWQSDPQEEIRALTTPRRWGNVHNASQDPMLKKEETSNVFRYDALDRGQTFIAYVIASNTTALDEIEACLPTDTLYLGGSQTAGYGLTSLTTTRVEDWEGEFELDYDIVDLTVITLLSDAILTFEGQPTTDFHVALEAALGRKIDPPRHTYAESKLVGGFNRKWGLPLPQHWAVSMGSTFAYDAEALDVDELDTLIEQGIGWRRGEGFGRIAVNLNAKEAFSTTTPEVDDAESQRLSDTSKTLAQQMARRHLMKAVQSQTLEKVKDTQINSAPQNTQLSRLRLLVRQAQRDNDLSGITEHLNSLKKLASDQFRERRLDIGGGTTLSWDSWLRERASRRDGLSQIGVDPSSRQFQIAGEWPPLDDALHVEVTCHLIETVVRKALKERD